MARMALREKTRALEPMLRELQRRWPDDLQLWLDWKKDGVLYHALPYVLRGAFPGAAEADLDRLTVATRMFLESILLADKIVDGHDEYDPGQLYLRAAAMQFEAYRLFHQVVPADAPFWEHFRAAFVSWAGGCALDRRFHAAEGKRPELTVDTAVEIARGKFPFPRVTAYALAALSGDDRHLEALVRSIDHFELSLCYWDDLRDWRKDAPAGAPSLVLAHLFAQFPELRGGQGEAWIEALAQALFKRGGAAAVIRITLDHLDQADALVADIPVFEWREMIALNRTATANALRDAAGAARRRREAEAQPV
ncbi:MAG TPA: hypothetical protein VFX98_19990 [Longimicrobiaceae bacterium]|nr:hypothetical protein [Longimicrobiaceae bacterium]